MSMIKESLKRSVYYELATNDVTRKEIKPNWGNVVLAVDFNFGKYCVTHHGYCVTIDAYNATLKRLWPVARWDCSSENKSDYDNDIYNIYVAVKNKAEGKEYTDPYKNMTKDETVKDSNKRFREEMLDNAGDFLPYDTPKDLRQKIITQMKAVLTRNLNKHYNAKER